MFKILTTTVLGFFFPNDYVAYDITGLKIPAQAGICPSFDVPKEKVQL